MPSSEILDDSMPAALSRRTVVAAAWAAPVIALTVAAPAVATSHVPVDVIVSGSGSKLTVQLSNSGAGAIVVTVTPPKNGASIAWASGFSAAPTGKVQSFTVTATGPGSFTFDVYGSATGTITFTGQDSRGTPVSVSRTF